MKRQSRLVLWFGGPVITVTGRIPLCARRPIAAGLRWSVCWESASRSGLLHDKEHAISSRSNDLPIPTQAFLG